VNTDELKELDSEDTWDLENSELRAPITKNRRRTVVSVAFPHEDIATVRRAAGYQGKKVSEYIRSAAVDQATAHAVVTSIVWEGTTASGPIFVSGGYTSRGTAGPIVTEEKDEAENVAA
jgi:hypothetical protein